jgi:hypothetical protein
MWLESYKHGYDRDTHALSLRRSSLIWKLKIIVRIYFSTMRNLKKNGKFDILINLWFHWKKTLKMIVEHVLQLFHIYRYLRDIAVGLICKYITQRYTSSDVTLHVNDHQFLKVRLQE